MEKVATLVFFGYVLIVQTMITGELGYAPADLLVKFGFVVGISMVLGSGYAFLVPRTWIRHLLPTVSPARCAAPSAA
jgi:hypothetical protein